MITKDKIDELKKKYGIEERVIRYADNLLSSIEVIGKNWFITYFINLDVDNNMTIINPFNCENLNNILLFLKEVSELL